LVFVGFVGEAHATGCVISAENGGMEASVCIRYIFETLEWVLRCGSGSVGFAHE
jgi:hypothetical protein